MDNGVRDTAAKPATAARMYDYYLGGIHNFPADQEAAKKVIARYPFIPGVARANRAFLSRAVRLMVGAGLRQFLDVGSGIPTEGNVHEIAQAAAPEARVVYVDIDPVAVAESLEILDGNDRATALRGDLRSPRKVLEHPTVTRMLDFRRPVGVLLGAVLHFVPEDELAYDVVAQLLSAVPAGSYLVVSHTSREAFEAQSPHDPSQEDVYRRQTATPGTLRTRDEVERFFTGLELVDPGVVWVRDWRSEPGDPPAGDGLGGMWAGVGVKR